MRAAMNSYRVAIRSLGMFGVYRDGEAVPLCAWQSKKARDLLKILVTRHGHPATRDALMELIWPAQDPRRTSNRLSVALSTARSVLDPEHLRPADWFIRADRYTVRLELERLDVDVERFLADARDGLALYRSAHVREAERVLEVAEARYTGDFLEEDPYEDWTMALREEARAVYVDVATALARVREAEGDLHTAIRLRRRIVGWDAHPALAPAPLLAASAARS
jgi:DNA-binding SARP family transcriptional activator